MPSLFRAALLFESAANLASVFPMLLAPETTLSYLVATPSQITSATLTLTQWLAGLITLATAPLLLSYPETGSPAAVVARRRLTYQIMGISEVALVGIMLGQWVVGGSGMRDGALLVAIAALTGFAGVRGWFLFGRPGLMGVEGKGKKGQ
ncbi:uncharacterized protein LTR77_009010 [Saxophila tyrrhenica]|uniref:Uncharacterized protein n=1 Tax=Saxophila tyrrhenica TaxID=1690608 RepID=A0AAV9P265_9PEZI|nr:hypothetical protein LTR77_009010 [Saxophila tyrrhenica]